MTKCSSYIEKIDKLISKLEDLEAQLSNTNKSTEISNTITHLNAFKSEIINCLIFSNGYYKFKHSINLFLESLKYIYDFDLQKLELKTYNTYITKLEEDSKKLLFFEYHRVDDGDFNLGNNFNEFKSDFKKFILGWILLLIANIWWLYTVFDIKSNLFQNIFPTIILILNIIGGICFFYYIDKKYSNLSKLNILKYTINYPNPNIKTQDKLLDFLLQDLKDKDSSQIASDFQKYIKAK